MAVMCSRLPREITPATGHVLAAFPARLHPPPVMCSRFPREIKENTLHYDKTSYNSRWLEMRYTTE